MYICLLSSKIATKKMEKRWIALLDVDILVITFLGV